MESRLQRLFSIHFVGLYLGWLLAPLPFLLPVFAVQSLIFGRDPDEWMRGSLPLRDVVAIFTDNVVTWAAAYSMAWVVLLVLHKWGKFEASFPSGSFMAIEALRSVGGLAVLAVYEHLIIEGHYAGLLPGLSVPSSAEDAIAGMPTFAQVLYPWALITALFGDWHFYAQHRLLHSIPALYNAVHKVHHRSYNTNPFSGISMHPFEHIVYMSSMPMLPLLFAMLGTTVPYWVVRGQALGLIIFPIPGHIGTAPFERWHWLHHTKFNWNFGSSPLFDILLGTDYDSFKAQPVKSLTADAAAAQAAAVGANLSVEKRRSVRANVDDN